MNKTCILCGRDDKPWFSKKRCETCARAASVKKYQEKRRERGAKPIRRISEKKAQRLKDGGGELPVFLEIWNERPHICISCDDWLSEFSPQFCSHTIPKKKRDDLRLNKRNIELECAACHHVWDNGTWEEKVQLKSLDYKLKRIEELDPDLHAKMVRKMNEALLISQEKQTV